MTDIVKRLDDAVGREVNPFDAAEIMLAASIEIRQLREVLAAREVMQWSAKTEIKRLRNELLAAERIEYNDWTPSAAFRAPLANSTEE